MIKILVDSASDIDLEESQKMGIEFLPIEIMIDGTSYYDGVNLSHPDFFLKLTQCSDFPRTSQITEFRYAEKFEELTKNGDSLIAICLSSKLSGTYEQAVKASKNFKNVYVVDSLNACGGERILTEYAIRLVQKGLPAEEIVKKLNEDKMKIKLYAVIDTLKYLKKGGRISPLVAFAGTMLNIKPIISVDGGEIKLVGKALGSKKSASLLTDFVKKTKGIDFDYPFVIGYSNFTTNAAERYVQDNKELFGDHLSEVRYRMLGSTIGTHIGTGAIAVTFFEKN